MYIIKPTRSMHALTKERSLISCTVRARSEFVLVTMPYSDYKKQRIIYWHTKGLRAPLICNKLANEGLPTTRQGIHKFLRKVEETGTIAWRPGSGRPSKVAGVVEQIIDAQMNKDDETTVAELQRLLRSSRI